MTILDVGKSLADKYLADHGHMWSELTRIDGSIEVIPPDGLHYEKYGFNRAHAKGRYGIFIPYLKPDGKLWMNETGPYGVLRYLGEPRMVGKDEKVLKVVSPMGRPSQLHFAPLRDGRTWDALPDGTMILHCESALKAELMTKVTGLPAVGYNGVSGYTSNKLGMELVHLYSEFSFHPHVNVILYDSDVADNPAVTLARDKLAHKMRHILACLDVRLATLPQREDGTNWGPDDYFLNKGLLPLMEVIDKAEPFQDEEFSSLVETMNERIRWVNQLTDVFDRQQRRMMKVRDAANHFANIKEVMPALKGKKIVTFGFPTWKESINRECVDIPGYEYLGPEFFEQDGLVCANTYRPGGVEPTGDSTGLGIVGDMLERLFRNDDLQLLRSYLKFGRYTPHKPTSYCSMYSNVRGVGKGWFTELVRALFGSHNVGVTTADMLAEKYNAHTIGIRVLLAHEFQATDGAKKKAALNYLKSYIGDEYIPVRAMNTNVYNTRVKSLVFITSNDKGDIPSDGLGDRRLWYVEAGVGVGGDELVDMGADWWERAWKALHDRELMGRVAQWVYEADDVDFRSWRPPASELREEDLMEGQTGIVQAAFAVRKMAQELGVRATDGKAIRQLMMNEMEGQEIHAIKKSFGKLLRQAGWWTSPQYAKADGNGGAAWFTGPVSTSLDALEASAWVRADRDKWKFKY